MKPIRYGASWKSNAGLNANVAQEVIAPGANARGIVLWRAGAYFASGTNTNGGLLAKASVPANIVDGEVLAIIAAGFGVSGAWMTMLELKSSIFIRPGLGLYFIGDQGSNGSRYVLYDLL